MPTSPETQQIAVIIHKKIKSKLAIYAKDERWSVSRAAAVLIEEGLKAHGYLEDEENIDTSNQESPAESQHL